MATLAPLSLVPPAGRPKFVAFDERLVSAEPGVIVVRAPAETRGPIVAHASRRLRTSGYHLVEAAVRAGTPLFREVAMHLGLTTIPVDPTTCAAAIATAAISQRAAIVGPLPKEGTWDHAVACELAKNARFLLAFVTEAETITRLGEQSVDFFELGSELEPGDKLRWLSAVAESAQADLPAADFRALEAWWAKARRVVPDARATFDDLGLSARHLLTCLALAGRSLPLTTMATLEPESSSALAELVAAGLASRTAGFVAASPSTELTALEGAASTESRFAVARCLANIDSDPWALTRASELFATVGDFDQADALIEKALQMGTDAQVGAELRSRWFDAVAPLTSQGSLALRIKAAQRALHIGEAADAQRWCASATALSPNDPIINLLMARAFMQLGDIVAARVCLSQAETNASSSDEELSARVASERAEVSYLGGELEVAAVHAKRAVDLAHTASTRLAARGTLGKILLAQGSWDLADAHFTEDGLVASSAGETTAELRARLNRAIALLSKGRLDEARALLERVLEDGTRLNEDRARAYALANLGIVAYRQHDYGSALRFWEQTIGFPQALRGRLSTAHTIGNLADLRLRLGLVDHAEHAIAFGRKLLSGSAPPRSAALFKYVAAQIALARGNTELSRREVESSLVDAQASGDRDCLASAYLVSARVSLEDGDLVHASEALDRAQTIASSPRGMAEAAIVRAALLRAMGEPALDSASEALRVARACGEDDLLLEIHTLLAILHRDNGDPIAAQAHCTRAIAVRDQIAGGLPGDVRAAFLAKPETMVLSRFQSTLAHDRATGPDGEEEAPRTERSIRVDTSSSREMVGDDPQIRALAVAVRKVARSNSTVLIRGESGTGKELIAEALHRASDRSSGPLVSVNCAALVETLLLSELFGHEKGAFTGASARRRGRFEMAEGGTLFLDEIGDISSRTQVALLRVLQERTFERVGGTAPIRANVRVVCATHRDLRAMVERGEFREDLYYRLRGITLEVPALRARLGDLPKIAEHLLRRIADERGGEPKRLSSDALDLLGRHRWPGNVRELENVLRAVSLFAEGNEITATDVIENVDELRAVARNIERAPASQAPISLRSISIPPPPSARDVRDISPASVGDIDEEERDSGLLPDDEANATAVAYAQVRQGAISLSDIKRQIERDCITRALAETKGNITRAATLLGMKRPRLSQLVKQYGLSVASSEGNS